MSNKNSYSANFSLKDFVVFLLMPLGRTFNAGRAAICERARLLVRC